MMNVGIDISKAKFDVGFVFGSSKAYKSFENNASGFAELLAWMKQKNVAEPHFCMEATGCYHRALAEFLHESGQLISVVNPLQIKRFRESKFIRQKTDKSDALVIAAFCEQNNPPAWTPKSEESAKLAEINHHIDDLKGELRRWNNRLEKNFLCGDVESAILKKISEIEAEIRSFENELKEIIKSSENLSQKHDNLLEIVGVGERLITTLLAEMPDVSNFKTAEQYAAYAGVTPSHFQSGSSVHGKSHITSIGNREVRAVLYMSAICVKNHNEYFKDWVQKLEKKGKLPKVIICAVMRKLLTIIFGMLKSGTAFDPVLAFQQGGDMRKISVH
jgi:transposase